MKKSILIIPFFCLALLNCSCTTEASPPNYDLSMAADAAKCFCEIKTAIDIAKENQDDEKKKEMRKKMHSLEKTLEKHVEAGDYTEDEVETLINNSCGQ